MAVTSATEHDATPELKAATAAFVKAVDDITGEIPEEASGALRSTTVMSGMIQLLLNHYSEQVPDDLPDEKFEDHMDAVVRGIGSGIAAFMRNGCGGSITGTLAEVLRGASEVEFYNSRNGVFRNALAAIVMSVGASEAPEEGARVSE